MHTAFGKARRSMLWLTCFCTHTQPAVLVSWIGARMLVNMQSISPDSHHLRFLLVAENNTQGWIKIAYEYTLEIS